MLIILGELLTNESVLMHEAISIESVCVCVCVCACMHLCLCVFV